MLPVSKLFAKHGINAVDTIKACLDHVSEMHQSISPADAYVLHGQPRVIGREENESGRRRDSS